MSLGQLSEQFKLAFSYYQNSQYDLADFIFSKILESKPDHFDSLLLKGIINVKKNTFIALELVTKATNVNPNNPSGHYNLGLILEEMKLFDKAIESYERTVHLRPDFPDAWLNRGNVLHALMNLNDAVRSYDMAIRVKPDFAEAYYNRGVVLKELNRFGEAKDSYDIAICLRPDFAEAYYNRGVVLKELNHLEEAKDSYDLAISLRPDFADAYYNRGEVLKELNRFEEAKDSYDTAISLRPDFADAYCNRALVLEGLNRFEEANDSYDTAIRLRPDFAGAYYNRGAVLKELNRFEEAKDSYDIAISLRPDFADAYYNRGAALKELNRFEEAKDSYDTAIRLRPDFADAYYNRAIVLTELNRFQEAIENYDIAIRIKPDFANAKFNKSIIFLLNGNLKEGFGLYEFRWEKIDPATKRNFDQPLWLGKEKLEAFITQKPIVKNLHEVLNKKILIWHEQGIGDFVMFSGLLEEMAALSPDIQILIDPRFLSLYKRSMPHLKFLDKGLAESKIDFDVHMPIGDLGKYFRNSVKDFDLNRKGYLISDSNKTQQIKDGLAKNKKYFCGLSWKSKREKLGKSKSIDLTDLLPILKNKNITFVSLQHGDVTEELRSLSENHGVFIHENKTIDNFNDLDGHASLIDACDFVITVSNSTAHIAGALGKETYLMLPLGFAAMWYWSNQSENKSIWYPSISIFQKTIVNDWEAPVQSINNLLENKIIDKTIAFK